MVRLFLVDIDVYKRQSQAFALNSIADDSFALENLTYAVTHHSTTGIPHLYTLTNLYRSFGLVGGIGARCV